MKKYIIVIIALAIITSFIPVARASYACLTESSGILSITCHVLFGYSIDLQNNQISNASIYDSQIHLRSPNSVCHLLQVDNSGVLSTTSC